MVHVHHDDAPRWSGLYDAEGRRLMHKRIPFGFRARGE
jgi:hypothetical protein